MKLSFNLKNHLKKQAFYEGAQELMRADRKKMDRQKELLDQGLSPHEAWQKCQDEYDNKGKDGSYLE
jgi:hypothetical protein